MVTQIPHVEAVSQPVLRLPGTPRKPPVLRERVPRSSKKEHLEDNSAALPPHTPQDTSMQYALCQGISVGPSRLLELHEIPQSNIRKTLLTTHPNVASLRDSNALALGARSTNNTAPRELARHSSHTLTMKKLSSTKSFPFLM